MTLTVGSCFAGIGGLDLGLERAGMEVRWQIERDPFCQRVLAKHWPNVTRYGDINDVGEVEPVDLICGGVPCQPWSVAGKRGGQSDERDLWPAFWRLCLRVRPRFIIVEEVPGFAVPDGLGRALTDLAEGGYDAEWFRLSAADVGAPHVRERMFIVADAGRIGRGRLANLASGDDARRDDAGRKEKASRVAGGCEEVPDAESVGRGSRGARRATAHREGRGDAEREALAYAAVERRGEMPLGEPLACRESGTACGLPARQRGTAQVLAHPDGPRLEERQGEPGDDGTELASAVGGGWWLTEPDVGRVAHGVPARVDRLRSLGNAVVPQVAEVIGRRILAMFSEPEGKETP